jgi:integrase
MPSKRGRRYKTDRHYPGVGRIHRSLRTDRAELAEKRETMLLTMCNRGMTHLVRAYRDGEVDIVRLEEAYETSQLPKLTSELRQKDVSLDEAWQRFEPTLTNITRGSRDNHRTTFRHLKAYNETCKPAAKKVRALMGDRDFPALFTGFLRDERGLSDDTILRLRANISRFSGYCLKHGWLDERPSFERIEKPGGRIRHLDAGEVALYLAHMRPDMRPVFVLLIGTGIDLGEAIAGRYYPDRGVRVCDLSSDTHGGWLWVPEGKTKYRTRQVFLWPWVWETLQDHIQRYNLSGDDKLFTWGHRTVQKAHEEACRDAGIKNYRIKDHRHTAAVAMARAAMPLDLIQRQLGHGRIVQTMVYARYHPAYGDYSKFTAEVQGQLGGRDTTVHTTPPEEPAPRKAWHDRAAVTYRSPPIAS